GNGNGNGTNGTANTGGGGGASGDPGNGWGTIYRGGTGGSGIVIVRYAGTTQASIGGTKTVAGGYTTHTFTTQGAATFTTP
ncbi:MAG: hypothetical protein H7338_04665, partial [Candidatus Sericytochromatia bacterium]|nr:hypothetical protein [Candidatus Sericytochromatia bacterium]